MDVQLESLLGPGGELVLLSIGIVGELNTLVNCWEVDQRVEKTDPMQTSFQHLFLIDILGKIVANDGVLGWLDTFDGHSYVNYEGHKAETQGEEAASFAGGHAAERLGAVLKTIVHYSSKMLIR